jgi:hypothetical protein
MYCFVRYYSYVGRRSSVDIAICYELGGRGIKTSRGEVLLTRPAQPWGPLGIL